jgi:hypothetical protein
MIEGASFVKSRERELKGLEMLKKKSAQPQREGVSIIESSKRET